MTTKKIEAKEEKLENAYILPAEVGDQIRAVLSELPIKYAQMIGPLLNALNRAYRGEITVKPPVKSDSK